VVDNASTDDTCRIVETEFPEVTLVRNRKNVGFAGGQNVGARHALAQGAAYVALLNQDIVAEPLWLETLMAAAAREEEYGILTPLQLEYDGDRIDPHVLARLLKYHDAFRRDHESGSWGGKVYEHRFSFGAALCVRRAVLETVGLFDPFYFMYHEESDFLQRCRYRGFRMALVTDSRIHHWHTAIHPEEMSLRSVYYSCRNDLLVRLKAPEKSIFGAAFACLVEGMRLARQYAASGRAVLKLVVLCGIACMLAALSPWLCWKRWRERRQACYL
jgi:GT2 family glycosyltransferase